MAKQKRYVIELDCCADDNIPYDDLDAQKRSLQKQVKEYHVKVNSFYPVSVSYAAEFEGTRKNLKKLIDECFGGMDDVDEDWFEEA